MCWVAAVGAAVVAMCAGIGGASAKIFTMTYTGVVSEVEDNRGEVFGPGDLLNKPFTAVYRFDTELGQLNTYAPPADDFYGQELKNLGATNPLIGGGITINGVTFGFSGLNGYALTGYYPTEQAGAPSSGLSAVASRSTQSGRIFESVVVRLGASEMGAPATFEDFTASGPGFFTYEDNSRFLFTRTAPTGGFSVSTVIDLSIKEAWISVEPSTAPIPEPGAWALMIGGFALTGAALRRRARLANL